MVIMPAMTRSQIMLVALSLLATAACGPSVEVEDVDAPELDHGPVNVPAALTVAPTAAPSPAPPVPCPCPAPQVCDPDPESGDACRCPDAPEDVEAVCEEGERVALCGVPASPSEIPVGCRRIIAHGIPRWCCQD